MKADILKRSDAGSMDPVVSHEWLSLFWWRECRKTQRPAEPMGVGTSGGRAGSRQQKRAGRKQRGGWGQRSRRTQVHLRLSLAAGIMMAACLCQMSFCRNFPEWWLTAGRCVPVWALEGKVRTWMRFREHLVKLGRDVSVLHPLSWQRCHWKMAPWRWNDSRRTELN